MRSGRAVCDDATFILLRDAAVISFDRETATCRDAVFFAYRQSIGTGCQIFRFEPDFLVSASDIAARSGLTGAAVSLFVKEERRDGFPVPHARLDSSDPFWDWVAVSRWLFDHKDLPQARYAEAVISWIINVGAQINQVE
ncbi:MAG: hypothetical protein RIT14_2827, partial [Pseudomonadota bacterium]